MLLAETVHFGDDVAKVVRKILLIGEVAALARDLELGMSMDLIHMRAAILAFNVGPHDYEEGSKGETSSGLSYGRRDRYTGSLTDSQKNELMGLLESWEEPEKEKKAKVSLQFSRPNMSKGYTARLPTPLILYAPKLSTDGCIDFCHTSIQTSINLSSK